MELHAATVLSEIWAAAVGLTLVIVLTAVAERLTHPTTQHDRQRGATTSPTSSCTPAGSSVPIGRRPGRHCTGPTSSSRRRGPRVNSPV
ncbi:MAG: hypothetical protein QOD63_1473 [Actinomycetota bacterium]|nr:hypothetical protein [Actinomycetota bacterium]